MKWPLINLFCLSTALSFFKDQTIDYWVSGFVYLFLIGLERKQLQICRRLRYSTPWSQALSLLRDVSYSCFSDNEFITVKMKERESKSYFKPKEWSFKSSQFRACVCVPPDDAACGGTWRGGNRVHREADGAAVCGVPGSTCVAGVLQSAWSQTVTVVV